MYHPIIRELLAAEHRRDLIAAAARSRASRHARLRPAVTLIERGAVADAAPILLSLAPFAAFIGVQVSGGRDILGGLSGSLLLFAGSAQIATLNLLAQGAGIGVLLGTVALINARFVAYSAALAPNFAQQPTWFRWLAPHLLVDQTYALASGRHDLDEPARFRRYWLTAGLAIAIVWLGSMTVGTLAGPIVPRSPATEFLPVGALIGLLVTKLRDRPSVCAAAVGAAIAILAPLPTGAGVLLGTVTGAAVGLAGERVAP